MTVQQVADAASDGRRIFRVAYGSRAVNPMQRDAVITLADEAADNNRRSAVSGVLFSGHGAFVQWLEGPEDAVCPLMARIEADPRHRDVTILSAGWAPERRYARWPMRLEETHIPQIRVDRAALEVRAAPCDTDKAMAAFDRMADAHRVQAAKPSKESRRHAAFAKSLIANSTENPARFPRRALADLRLRAQCVDDVCAAFMSGWRDDRFGSSEVAVGMANLFCLWNQAGRAPEPVEAQEAIAVVVPPGNSEVLGATVKADLLRAAGVSVRVVAEPDPEAAIHALSKSALKAAVVTGSRVGWSADQARSEAFAERLRERLPATPIYVGGRDAGLLCDWPSRMADPSNEAAAGPVKDVEWLAREALASLKRKYPTAGWVDTLSGRA
ncbi:MAG: BLUF domain-containing protein [Pseudomonadota bacterium]